MIRNTPFKTNPEDKISQFFGINRYILLDIINPGYYNKKRLARSLLSSLQMATNNIWYLFSINICLALEFLCLFQFLIIKIQFLIY